MERITKTISVLLLCLFLLNLFLSSASEASEFRFSPRPNRANLINWHSWSKASFEKARKSDKLILLSLSAVWCHWCHVMDETTYSDQKVIEFINKYYIAIRVDADRRPDIDNLYNQGGWPSTVILTPEGEILDGGTYIPPDRMLEMLKHTLAFYKNNKWHIKKRIKKLKKLKKQNMQSKKSIEEDYVVVETIFKSLEENFDERYGGFDIGQKFPRPEVLEFLMLYYLNKPNQKVKRMILQSLDAMAMTRLHDHVEGGFFRYSVKRDWSKPHFEKMLDVNAGLLKDYVTAGSIFNRDDYIKVAKDVYNYLYTHLYDQKTGLFYGSQDADEVYYNSRSREGLPSPSIDKTIYADRNGLALSALIRYSALTGRSDVKAVAIKAGRSLIERFYKKGVGIYHYMTDGSEAMISGLLQDNVLVAIGLLDLYELTGQGEFLIISEDIAKLLKKNFATDSLLKASLRPSVVNPVTEGLMKKYSLLKNNYYALILFNRLINYDSSFKDIANTLRRRLSNSYKKLYFTSALFAIALEYSMQTPFEIDIVTTLNNREGFMTAINSVFMPFKFIRVYSLDRDRAKIKQMGYPEKEFLYICRGKRCFKPFKLSSDTKKRLVKILSIAGR